MILCHVTSSENAAAIKRDGFRDTGGSYMTESERRGELIPLHVATMSRRVGGQIATRRDVQRAALSIGTPKRKRKLEAGRNFPNNAEIKRLIEAASGGCCC
jgi:hypothetical protein